VYGHPPSRNYKKPKFVLQNRLGHSASPSSILLIDGQGTGLNYCILKMRQQPRRPSVIRPRLLREAIILVGHIFATTVGHQTYFSSALM